MEKKMFKTGKALTIVRVSFLLLIMAAMLGVSLWLLKTVVTGKNIITADSFGDYVYIDAKYASQPLGEDDEGNQYLFLSTEEKEDGILHDYMFRISKAGFEQSGLKDLIDATYSEDKTVPPLRLYGYLQHPSDDFIKLAEESYKFYVGDDSITDPLEYLGNAYLEYSAGEKFWQRLNFSGWLLLAGLLFVFVTGLLEIIRVLKRQAKKDRKIQLCRQLYANDPEYAHGLEEIDQPETLFFKECQCYVTPNYIVSYQEGLEVFRIDQIRELYGYDQGAGSNLIMGILLGYLASHQTYHYLVAVTADNEAHMFAALLNAGRIHNQIVFRLLSQNMDMFLGRSSIPGHALERELEALNLSRVPGFYGSANVWKGRVGESFLL